MTVTLLGANLLLGGVFVEPRRCPLHGRMSLDENLSPCRVEQRRHLGVAPLLVGVTYETSVFPFFSIHGHLRPVDSRM
jgi:hypothetical protein